MSWLRDIRVVDFSSGIAGPYCAKLFADAGADVIKVETATGDPLRSWSSTGGAIAGDGALFRFLNHSKRSVVGMPGDRAIDDLILSANLVVEDFAPAVSESARLRRRFPGLVVLSITPYGHTGPYANRPWTEFTLQAECGSIGMRGMPDMVPFQAGGRITEWTAGTFAAVPALDAVRDARRSGCGRHIDFSMFECMSLATTNFLDLFSSLFGRPELTTPARMLETPSIEPTADGYVGFCTNSGQQFRDFLILIERPDLLEDRELPLFIGRVMRFREWNEIVHAWTREHTTAEIVERASALRIPVAPICNGKTVLDHEQLSARGVFVKDPLGEFLHPRPPYRIGGVLPPLCRRAPRLGEHTGEIEPGGMPPASAAGRENQTESDGSRPVILDVTNWWAGPSAAHMLALLGADVIHVESIQRPDGMRFVGGAFHGTADWWERSPFFLAVNSNKRGVTLNLADPTGKDLFLRLVQQADAVLENFSPRVMEQFGLTWDVIHATNPRCIMVRMPAFGLSGPWRDKTGFAQTMEQMTGMAWVTGHPEDQPRIQRGPCDPLAGMHAAFALLVALDERERTGIGQLVEVTMVEAALNAAAEQVIEYTAYGQVMRRAGNRSVLAAPQGLYRCHGEEKWLALSVATDAQWKSFRQVLGEPSWMRAERFESRAGRLAGHDAIDREIQAWAANRELHETVAGLLAAGVPAAPVVDPRATSFHPQMRARRFFEEPDHPIVGRHPTPTAPFRWEGAECWLTRPAPTLGQHNREILSQMLGVSDEELRSFEERKIIGTRPQGE
jgi:crotonobetainyl-CoA:carnitine CoA-transferase CaiB-like acyl-CoA transferase